MSYDADLVEIAPEEGAYSKYLQAVFCEKMERPAEKLRSSGKSGQGSRTERKLKHQGERYV